MPFMDEFGSITVTRKRNHIYYGPTESIKMASTLDEIMVDLNTIYDTVSTMKDNLEALASGFLSPSGYENSLFDLRRKLYHFENVIEQRIYIQAEQDSVFEE
jgi:hypothetical protein